MKHRIRSPLTKRVRKGFRGYPVATIAYYGRDSTRASKVAVGIVRSEGEEPAELERWFSDEDDVRTDPTINQAILTFVRTRGVRTVAMGDRIIGCPHEEGVDYPSGTVCPQCPYWASRDRWSGEVVQ
jgi:hypothetical protein